MKINLILLLSILSQLICRLNAAKKNILFIVADDVGNLVMEKN